MSSYLSAIVLILNVHSLQSTDQYSGQRVIEMQPSGVVDKAGQIDLKDQACLPSPQVHPD